MADSPDLILLELNVARVDGLHLLTLIRAHPATSHVPTAIITSAETPADKAEAARLGADGVIVKPTGYDDFVHDVGTAIRRLLASSGVRACETQAIRFGVTNSPARPPLGHCGRSVRARRGR